jgi:hypothetical protein
MEIRKCIDEYVARRCFRTGTFGSRTGSAVFVWERVQQRGDVVCSVLGRDGKQGFGSDEGEVLRKREGNYVVSKWRYEGNDVKGCMRFHNAVRNSRAEIRSERHGLLLLKKCWIILRAK